MKGSPVLQLQSSLGLKRTPLARQSTAVVFRKKKENELTAIPSKSVRGAENAQAEMGQLLGLDRSPEVRTLRNKLKLLTTNEDEVKAWQRELSVDWMEANPEFAGHLYVDGHVRVYFGSKANLPRRYVAR